MIKVAELYIKQRKGLPPEQVQRLTLIKNEGVLGDVFAVGGDRQVCLLLKETKEDIQLLCSQEPCIRRFSCNIVLDGCSLPDLRVGCGLSISGALLEITQIGRQCHNLCSIGSCPLVGGAIFARVVGDGEISVGDEVSI